MRFFRPPKLLHSNPRVFKSPRERQFAEWATAQGIVWQYEPERFRLSQGMGEYTPDFYFPDTRTYIEVVGSRQAFHHNRKGDYPFRKSEYL